MRFLHRLFCFLFVVFAIQSPLLCQDADDAGPEKIAEVNELARKLALCVKGSIVDGNFRETLEAIGPVLTHVDDVASSTLWLSLNSMGRPEVVLAISSWKDQRFIEACSFSQHVLEFDILGFNWKPSAARDPIEIQDAPQPEESEEGRLKQMQKLLERFGGSEKYLGGEVEFDIQLEPIYRYPKSSQKDDGAIFSMVRDGDPEALLVLETSKDGWQYMVGRMTGNPMSYTLDGKKISVELERTATAPYVFVRRPPE